MAWQVEVPTCRPADLSLIPGVHRVEGEKVLIVIFQTPHIHYGLRLPCPSPSLSFLFLSLHALSLSPVHTHRLNS